MAWRWYWLQLRLSCYPLVGVIVGLVVAVAVRKIEEHHSLLFVIYSLTHIAWPSLSHKTLNEQDWWRCRVKTIQDEHWYGCYPGKHHLSAGMGSYLQFVVM